MPSTIAYRKTSDAWTTHELRLPDGAVELATLGGVTYVSLPDGSALPTDQPAGLAWEQVSVTPELKDALRAASPHCALINDRVQEQIRSRYTPEDEAYFARIGVGAALGAYEFEPGERDKLLMSGAYFEDCRAWGRQQRAALGL